MLGFNHVLEILLCTAARGGRWCAILERADGHVDRVAGYLQWLREDQLLFRSSMPRTIHTSAGTSSMAASCETSAAFSGCGNEMNSSTRAVKQ